MKTYWFQGSVTKGEVLFAIKAPSVAKAKERARRGDFDKFWDQDTRILLRCDIDPDTCEYKDRADGTA